jgi:hypothetical protein
MKFITVGCDVLRKKDILGNFVKKKEIVCSHTIKKVVDEEHAYSALVKFLPGCKTTATAIVAVVSAL